jgi:transcription antitermination protein NusB
LAGTRSEARERALELLYESDIKGVDAARTLSGLPVPPDPFTSQVVRAVLAEGAALDRQLEPLLRQDWTLDRVPLVERIILRMATWELLHTDTPPAVVLNEAVQLAKRYSREEAGPFVNGLLAAVVDTRGR